MADNFQVGDVVVKVAGCSHVGMIDRIVSIGHWPGGQGLRPCAVLHFAKPHPDPSLFGWAAYNFRKLPKADDRFAEQMRALKPHREKVPA